MLFLALRLFGAKALLRCALLLWNQSSLALCSASLKSQSSLCAALCFSEKPKLSLRCALL